jgi:hypothetical protein
MGRERDGVLITDECQGPSGDTCQIRSDVPGSSKMNPASAVAIFANKIIHLSWSTRQKVMI